MRKKKRNRKEPENEREVGRGRPEQVVNGVEHQQNIHLRRIKTKDLKKKKLKI